MATTISLSSVWSEPDAFTYNAARPTYFSELLAHRTLRLNAAVAAAGGVILVEQTTPDAQQAALDTYLESFQTWLSDTAKSVSDWLKEEEGSRLLPAVVAAPVLPAILAGAVVLYKGVLVKMTVDTIATIARTASQAQADRRNSEMPRIIDKALNKSSWFGLKKESWLQKICENLETSESSDYGKVGMTDMLINLFRGFEEWTDENGSTHSDPRNVAEAILVLAKKPKLLKLLLQAVISAGGDIETIDFDLLPGSSE